MAFNYMENISYNNNRPNFERDSVKTVAQLLAVNPADKGYDYGHIVFCEEDGRHYKFNYDYDNPPANDEKDAVIGWFIPSDGTRKAVKKSDGSILSKGYIILNRNRDFVSQINEDEIIYEIRDYFDLGGEEVTLPANCVLKFSGGMLANGTVIGNGVTIEAPLVRILGDDITLKGDFNCDFYPEWFGAVTYSEATAIDNAAVFNNAVAQIYNMSGTHDLILTGTYLIKDTIFLKPKVSLIGRYAKTCHDAFVGNQDVGSGFLVDFDDNNKYAIDTCLTQLSSNRGYSGKKLAVIKYNYLWFDDNDAPENSYTLFDKIVTDGGTEWLDDSITGKLWVNGWRKSNNIKNIILQPLNKPTQSNEIPFGGIRLNAWYSGTIDSVTIQGFVVGLNLSNSWSCYINRLNILTHYIGVYFGKFCTQCDIRDSEIQRMAVYRADGTKVYFDHKAANLVYRDKANLLLPYDDAGRAEGDEGFTHSITKHIATPESVDETFISTNYPEPNSNVLTLEQGTISESGLSETSSNYCRTPMLTKFKLIVNNGYVISKLVQYDLDGTFIASYDNRVIDNENVVWGKTSLQINDTNYKWIAVISNKDNTKTIKPSEAIISSFLSGIYLFNSTQLLTVAIMTESYSGDQTKLLLDNIVFQAIDGIFINTNICNVSFNFCYIESVNKLGFYTHSGIVRWLNPSFAGNRINPYAAVTFEGKITIEDMASPRCYPSYTMEDVKNGLTRPRYYVTPQTLYYDKFIVTPENSDTIISLGLPLRGTVEPDSVAAAKQLIPKNDTYYVGGNNWMDKSSWEDYNELGTGLEPTDWTSFENIINHYNPKVATIYTIFTNSDFSLNGTLFKNVDYTFIKRDGATYSFALTQPMRLQDSKIKVVNHSIVAINGFDYVFEVSRKCTLWFNKFDLATGTKLIKLVSDDNRPVEIDIIYNKEGFSSSNVYNKFLSHLDEYGVKYTLKITTPIDTKVYTNTMPPTKGVISGETFIYNGKTLTWNGTEWGATIPNYALYVALGAEYNDTDSDITKSAPWGEEVVHKTGCWYYNGIGDLTDTDMVNIYLHKDLIATRLNITRGASILKNIKTTVPIESGYALSSINITDSNYLFYCSKTLIVLRWALWNNNTGTTPITLDDVNTGFMLKMGASMTLTFADCHTLRYIYPINVSSTTSFNRTFAASGQLIDVRLFGLKADVSFENSPNIRKECLLYIIANANPTTAITITLHATAHANLAEDTEIVAKLEEKNTSLSASGGSISLKSA